MQTGERQLAAAFEHTNNLQWLMRLATKAFICQPNVEGLQNLQEIPPNQPVIFATSHLSDVDVPATANVLLHYRPIDIVVLQTGVMDLKQIPFIYSAGRHNFHTIKNTFNLRTHTPHTQFIPADFQPMQEAMNRGRDIVIAAHKPTRNWKLPIHGGIGAAYLAQITGAPVVPVVLNIHSETPTGMAHDIKGALTKLIMRDRPKATLTIGHLMYFEIISKEDLVGLRTRELYKLLRDPVELIMKQIALMLPENKRGTWNEK